MKVLKIKHDQSPECPFDSMDLLYPCITENKDYSDGDIDRYLSNYLSYNQVRLHQSKICSLLDIDYKEFRNDYPNSNERIDILMDDLSDFISESMDNKETFCNEFGIKYLYQLSRGYSQGDASWVFICWTPEFGKKSGLSYNKVTESDMEGTFKLYGYWAWGDVFGFEIVDQTTCEHCGETHEKDIDSCWGFYGDNHFESGLVEHVRHHFDHLNDEEFKAMIKEIEVEY